MEISTEQQLKVAIEGILFVAPEPVTLNQLAATIQCKVKQVEQAVQQLALDYKERGIRLQRNGNRVQLVTAPELTPYVRKLLGLSISSKLSTPALETLAIVAYRQPITRSEIDGIRGVNSDSVLRTLLSRGIIESVGRLDTVGHPTLYGTTFEFLRLLGLENLEQLPKLELEDEEESVDTDKHG
ncbi:SMC-Scp complex subunit ScpB [Anaerolineales bacterium HSG6]|nr:SMC-Scp complex subunit ScpB [Anaerolineales bacterium HSG6]MDM8529599.1 SMC-Scp complex subunit ScpB [Anaerolineales bacterium HSG25]